MASKLLLPADRIVHRDVFRRLCHVRDLIHARFAEELSVEDLAAQAAMSPFHFLRQFQRVFGSTPHQYLANLRIEEAKRLLASGRMSVTEACFAVGFSSLGSFSTRFRRDVGASPAEFQRRTFRLVRVPLELPRLYIPGCFMKFQMSSFGEVAATASR